MNKMFTCKISIYILPVGLWFKWPCIIKWIHLIEIQEKIPNVTGAAFKIKAFKSLLTFGECSKKAFWQLLLLIVDTRPIKGRLL